MAMKQDSSLVKNHSHDSIAQVAWLYHVGNLSQQEISDRLGISRFKIVRLLAEAKQLGVGSHRHRAQLHNYFGIG
jgi:DNA-binding transcriptional regulator LsrR (DeoR family)